MTLIEKLLIEAYLHSGENTSRLIDIRKIGNEHDLSWPKTSDVYDKLRVANYIKRPAKDHVQLTPYGIEIAKTLYENKE